ncbi:MAG: hypothetical protein SGCHY_005069, partial [Lobulomycetales sp.]
MHKQAVLLALVCLFTRIAVAVPTTRGQRPGEPDTNDGEKGAKKAEVSPQFSDDRKQTETTPRAPVLWNPMPPAAFPQFSQFENSAASADARQPVQGLPWQNDFTIINRMPTLNQNKASLDFLKRPRLDFLKPKTRETVVDFRPGPYDETSFSVLRSEFRQSNMRFHTKDLRRMDREPKEGDEYVFAGYHGSLATLEKLNTQGWDFDKSFKKETNQYGDGIYTTQDFCAAREFSHTRGGLWGQVVEVWVKPVEGQDLRIMEFPDLVEYLDGQESTEFSFQRQAKADPENWPERKRELMEEYDILEGPFINEASDKFRHYIATQAKINPHVYHAGRVQFRESRKRNSSPCWSPTFGLGGAGKGTADDLKAQFAHQFPALSDPKGGRKRKSIKSIDWKAMYENALDKDKAESTAGDSGDEDVIAEFRKLWASEPASSDAGAPLEPV